MLGSRFGIYASQQPIDTPLILWLDATDSTTMFADVGGTTPITNNTAVRRWNSKTSNGIYMTESTSTAVYKTGRLNGYSGVRCDGSKGTYSNNRPFGGTVTGATAIVVMRWDYSGTGNGSFLQFELGANRTRYQSMNASENFGFSSTTTVEDESLTYWSIYAIRADSVSGLTKVYKNNTSVEIKSAAYGTNNWLNVDLTFGSPVGSSYPIYGDLFELYLYKEPLSLTDLGTKLSELRTKYGLVAPSSYLYDWDCNIASSVRNNAGNQASNGENVAKWYANTGTAAISDWLSVNSTNGASFDATNKALAFNGSQQMYITGLTNNTMKFYDKTYIMVVTTGSDTSYQCAIAQGSFSTSDTGVIYINGNNGETWSQNFLGRSSTGAFSTSTKVVLAISVSNMTRVSSRWYKNGVKVSTPPNIQPMPATMFTDGTSDHMLGGYTGGDGRKTQSSSETYKGKIHELVIYEGFLFDDVIISLMTPFMTKWGVS